MVCFGVVSCCEWGLVSEGRLWGGVLGSAVGFWGGAEAFRGFEILCSCEVLCGVGGMRNWHLRVFGSGVIRI